MPSRSLRSEKLDLQLTRKAQTALRPPRRGKAEAELVRRFVFWWFTGRDTEQAIWPRLGSTARDQPHLASKAGSRV